MNLQTIAAAIATTVGTVTATNGTQTETLTATADLPDTVSTRALLVYPPEGTLEIIMGPRFKDVYVFPVKLLRDPLAVTPRVRWLYAWATALRVRIQTDIDLGVSGVSHAESVSLRMDLAGDRAGTGEPYGGGLFDVVEIGVRVQLNEPTTIVI